MHDRSLYQRIKIQKKAIIYFSTGYFKSENYIIRKFSQASAQSTILTSTVSRRWTGQQDIWTARKEAIEI
jgi:hypothetical protein